MIGTKGYRGSEDKELFADVSKGEFTQEEGSGWVRPFLNKRIIFRQKKLQEGKSKEQKRRWSIKHAWRGKNINLQEPRWMQGWKGRTGTSVTGLVETNSLFTVPR